MDKIIFDKIQIEGFCSIVNTFEYNFDSPGVNAIVGKNGSGKTTILNALSWVIYKQLLKPTGSSIKPWDSILPKNFNGTKVSLRVLKGKKEMQIIRCDEYKGKVCNRPGKNSLFVLIDGELIKPKYKKEIQEVIEAFIGYSFNLFKNAVLFGQEMERLMKESGPNKRKLFEEMFDTSFIDQAREKAISKSQALEKIITDLQISYENAKDKVEATKEKIRELYADTQADISSAGLEITKIEQSMMDLVKQEVDIIRSKPKKTLKVLQEKQKILLTKIDHTLGDRVFRLEIDINSKESQVENKQYELNLEKDRFIKLPKKCGECGEPIKPEKRNRFIKSIKKNICKLSGELKVLKDELKVLNSRLSSWKKEAESQTKYEWELRDLNIKVNSLTKKIDLIKTSTGVIKEKQRQIDYLKEGISKTTKKRDQKFQELNKTLKVVKKKLNQEKAQLSKYQKRKEIYNWLINDALSNTGLKSYIFDAMIPLVNQSADKYAREIGFTLEVYIDLESSRKDIGIMIYKGKHSILYQEMSKGQKQLVDIVLAFAINDVLTLSKPVNLLLMDELFESLDRDNIELVVSLVSKKAEKTCLHLITHQYSFTPRNCKNTFLTLENGRTTAVA